MPITLVKMEGERLQHWLEDAHGWPRGTLARDRTLENLSGLKDHPLLCAVRKAPDDAAAKFVLPEKE